MRVALLLFLVFLSGCQHVAPSPPPPPVLGEIRDLRNGQTLTAQALLAQLSGRERLIVGEQHDNQDHHALQLWLLQAMSELRPQGSLLLEMLTPSQQARVDEVRRSAAYPVDLQSALGWQEGWDWQLYGPIVRFALAQPYPVMSANLDALEIRGIYSSQVALSGVRTNALSVRQPLLAQISESHCGLLPATQMPAMLAVQQHRDRRMAERLHAAPSPSMLLAGAYHARKDIGVPIHSLDLGEIQAPTVLMLAQAGEKITPAMADYVWYTPATPAPDYCEAMRRQFGQPSVK